MNEDRKIAVYLPKEYHESEEQYQVLYLLDGEWNFYFISALIDKLIGSGDMPKTIVVGMINNNRSKDLTPLGTNDNPIRFGGGEKFLRFLTEESQPWIDHNYRTHPHHTLAGHSFGGLFTLYSMMKSPDAFQSYIALSPSLGRNDEQQVKNAALFFKQESTFPKILYLGIGNEGGYTHLSTEKFADIVHENLPERMIFKYESLEEENHASMTISGFPNIN